MLQSSPRVPDNVTQANGWCVSAFTLSARLALMSAQACEGAHAAAQLHEAEAYFLYCKAMILLTTPKDGDQLLTTDPRVSDFPRAKAAIEVQEKVARYCISAANALQNGMRVKADLWREAAQVCETAVQIAGNVPLDARLSEHWEVYVLRAGVIAKKARRARW
jgi:hypothetical protein